MHSQCSLRVISGQTVPSQNRRLSALVQKRTNFAAQRNDAKCHKRTSASTIDRDSSRAIFASTAVWRATEKRIDPIFRSLFGRCGKAAMTKITVSYRRNDSDAITGRIFDRLVTHYGADSVFRDIDNIPPGIDYRKHISGALATTDILLAIVGPQWTGRTPGGSIRIQQATDLVRIEVETALRKDIPVVPVLVGNATMPQQTDLPDGLQDFVFRNAVRVDALEDFEDHVRRLIRSLDRLLQTLPSAQQETNQTTAPAGVSEKVAEVATGAMQYQFEDDREPGGATLTGL